MDSTEGPLTVAIRSESIEEYLEAIYKLAPTPQGASVKALAGELGVARPSVSEMLRRMVAAGLVARDETGAASLTGEGEIDAARLVRRHRLSERFLVDYLDLSWDQVHDEACKFEHVLSPEVEERLAEQLGNPRTCPHGHPIPAPDGRVPTSVTRPLSDLQPGESTTIAHISDEEPELLRYLASLGMVPTTEVAVENLAPFGGPLMVRIGEAHYALGREVAGKIFVTG